MSDYPPKKKRDYGRVVDLTPLSAAEKEMIDNRLFQLELIKLISQSMGIEMSLLYPMRGEERRGDEDE